MMDESDCKKLLKNIAKNFLEASLEGLVPDMLKIFLVLQQWKILSVNPDDLIIEKGERYDNMV